MAKRSPISATAKLLSSIHGLLQPQHASGRYWPGYSAGLLPLLAPSAVTGLPPFNAASISSPFHSSKVRLAQRLHRVICIIHTMCRNGTIHIWPRYVNRCVGRLKLQWARNTNTVQTMYFRPSQCNKMVDVDGSSIYRRTHSPSRLAWSVGWRPPGAQSAFIK